MLRILFFTAILVSILPVSVYAGTNITDPSRPVHTGLQNPGKTPIDSNILIVVNGKIAGTVRELKKDVNTMFSPDIIESMNVLKGPEATLKYGEKARSGAIEFVLKDVKIIDTDIPKDSNDDKRVFDKVEIEASFAGGDYAWRKYLERTLNASIPVDNNAPAGYYTVIAQFVVDKEGNISDVKALTDHGYGMEAEVIKVITKGPKWTPAMQSGRSVKAYRKQPVTFGVEDDAIEVKTKEQYVLQSGVKNPVAISVEKIKDEDIEVRLSQGTITGISEGSYEARVDKPGRVLMTIMNKKKDKEIGKIMFTVR